ncbi:MAG TPA: hypothetical protein VJ438_01605 [Candidatus Nanoarchaeia archaeon]|nr:hypothetical protein [Candidatus Nanoarchaeia archaeon]
MEFINFKSAYSGMKYHMEYCKDVYQNNSFRSENKRICQIKEIRAVQIGITHPRVSDTFELIESIDKNHKERIEMLMNLGDKFVNEKLIPFNTHYTYNERIHYQIPFILSNIRGKGSEANRQAFLSIWDPEKDVAVIGIKEIPCSIGYQFFLRENILHMVYYMRSLDIEIWPNDMYLSNRVHRYFADKIDCAIGRIDFLIGSFHSFIKEEGKE